MKIQKTIEERLLMKRFCFFDYNLSVYLRQPILTSVEHCLPSECCRSLLHARVFFLYNNWEHRMDNGPYRLSRCHTPPPI